MQSIDKNSKEKIMNIIVTNNEFQDTNSDSGNNDINFIFIQENKVKDKFKGNKNEPIINILRKRNSNINSELNKYTFKYRNNNLDLNKKFNDIPDEIDRQNKPIVIMVNQIKPLSQNRMNSNQNRIFNTNNNYNDTGNYLPTYNTFGGTPINNESGMIKTYVVPNGPTYGYSRTCCCYCQTDKQKKIIRILIIVGVILAAGVIVITSIIEKKSKDEDNNDDSNNSGGTSGEIKKTNEISDNNHTCDSGYYIPDDDSSFKDCQKCSVEGCTNCTGTYKSNICHNCGKLISVYKDEQIIRCNDPKPCEVGEEDKCKTCDKVNNECSECNTAYKLVDGKCKPDYFIKAVFLTKQKEDKIDIINSYGNIAHIFIEGKKITLSSTSYQFQKEGNQTVYFQFKYDYNYYGYGSQFFKNNKHLKSISFSAFNEFEMGFSLGSLFAGCTNLTSVDFSKLSYVYTSNMDSMFDGCINLTYINISNLKVYNKAQYIFNNCKSLSSINLSQLDVTGGEYLNNMFTNCTSLQIINLKGFKLNAATTIKSLFYNCYSLKSLDLSALKPTKLNNIYYAFYNCSSLTSINFLDFY